MFTYYDVLGVSPKANAFQIKKAYRSRVKQVHPDVVHSDHALRKVKMLNRAYAVLRDKGRRAEYDCMVDEMVGSYSCSTSAATGTSYRWVWAMTFWLIAAVALWFFTKSAVWQGLLFVRL